MTTETSLTLHRLHGGPLEGVTVVMSEKTTHYPAAFRLLRDGDNGETIIHVYAINRGHSAEDARPVRPTYHYSHTTII